MTRREMPLKSCAQCFMIWPAAQGRCTTCGAAMTARQRAKDAAEAVTAMQTACDTFNAAHAIGDTILCWTGLREGAPVARTIKYPAQILSGHTAVVFVSGGGGCIALSHVDN